MKYKYPDAIIKLRVKLNISQMELAIKSIYLFIIWQNDRLFN